MSPDDVEALENDQAVTVYYMTADDDLRLILSHEYSDDEEVAMLRLLRVLLMIDGWLNVTQSEKVVSAVNSGLYCLA